MLSSRILINVPECNKTQLTIFNDPSTNTDRCDSTTERIGHQDRLVALITASPTVNDKHTSRQYSTSDHSLDIIQLMGLEMPPVRRRGYNGTNYSTRNGPQSAGSLPNLHQPIPARSSISATSSPSNSHQRIRDAADLSLIGDDSSDSGVSSRSPTPNSFLTSAGAAGDQGPPDEHFLKKSVKEIKHVSNASVCDSNSSNSTRGSNLHQPFYPYQQHHYSHHSNIQLQDRIHHNHSSHRTNYQGNNSNGVSNGNSNGGVSVPKRRFHHSNRHCPPLQSAGRDRRLSGLVVQVPSPSSPPLQYPSPQSTMLSAYMNSSTQYMNTPPDRFLSKAHLVQVTKTPPRLTNGSRWDELSKAVWNKFLTNQQTEETYRKKITLWKCLYMYIKIMFPRYGLFLVGSTMSGFGSNTSDVDMCLLVRRQEMDQRSEALIHLNNVLQHLHQFDGVEKLELVQAKVPILKFRDRNQGIDVDLNCNNAVGIRNTHLLACYAKLDWRVRPLVLVVKLWAQWHDINDAKNMTISSYSLALMVIHFLQCGATPPVLPCLHLLHQSKFSPFSDVNTIDINEEIHFKTDNVQPLGELLLQFFSYYDSFDYSTFAVSVRLACRVLIEDCRRARTLKNEPHQWKYLCVEEPFDQTNTARSVYDLETFERIRTIIHVTYCNLKATHALDSIFRLDSPKHHSHHHHLQMPPPSYHHHHHHHHHHHQHSTNHHHSIHQQTAASGWTNQHHLMTPVQMQTSSLQPSRSCTSQSSTSSQPQTQTESHLL